MQQVSTQMVKLIEPIGFKQANPLRGIQYLRDLPVTQQIFDQGVRMGPKLKLDHTDIGNNKIHASVLIVTEGNMDTYELAGRLKLSIKMEDADIDRYEVKPVLIDKLDHCKAWLFRFITEMGKNFSYRIEENEYFVTVPSENNFSACVFSCNGRQKVKDQIKYEQQGGLPSVWKIVMESHNEAPFTLLISLGDTIYVDDLFENIPLFRDFKELSMEEKCKATFTQEMQKQLREYLFRKYCHHFSIDEFKTLLSTVLTIFTWDDHDIHDGAGSEDPIFQNCEVFQGIFEEAYHAFLVFQLHTNEQLKNEEGFIGNGCNKLFHFGPVSIFSHDTRSERTINQVFSLETRLAIKEALTKPLPEECVHLISLMGIPPVYPPFKGIEAALEKVNEYYKGKMEKIKYPPELLDDLRDEWQSPQHLEEKKELIKIYQEVPVRTTIAAGDVHVGAVGKFFNPNIDNPLEDPNNINVLITSPIGNKSPKALKYLIKASAWYHFGEKGEEVMEGTFANMDTYTKKGTNKKKKVITNQNWLRLTYRPETKELEGCLQAIKYTTKSFCQKIYDTIIKTSTVFINWCSSKLAGIQPIPIKENAKIITKIYSYNIPPLIN